MPKKAYLASHLSTMEAGANQDKIILLVQDRAGWHRSKKVNCPLSRSEV